MPAPAKFSTKIPGYPIVANRNIFQNELSYILDYVWQRISQEENSQDFIDNCYVCPNAHQDIIALAKELMEKRREEDNILSNYDISSIDQLPYQIAHLSAEKPFIVLGEVGRGKSSFLKYLRLVAARDILKSYIQIDIDFLDRPDMEDEIPTFIYNEVSRQLKEKYSIDVYENAFVRGVLHGEIMRLKNTPKGNLYENDLPRYREYEVEYIESIIKDHHNYFTKVMHHLKKGRLCSIALFFDNLDRRNKRIQESAFLKCSAIARDWCSLVFVCLRPSTFYESKQNGVLDSIAPKTFTVSQPDLSLVLKKRFAYAKSIAQGVETTEISSHVVPSKTISFDLPRVAKLFESCEFAAWKRHGIIPMLEAVSNGNIRTLLDLAKTILTSSYLDTKKILNFIERDGQYIIPDYEGVKMLIYGDYIHFDTLNSVFINLFDIQHVDPKEHFLRYAILQYLTRFFGNNTSRRFVHISSVHQNMALLGFCRVEIDDSLKYLYEKKCIRSMIEGIDWSESVKEICVTSLGRYHINNLLNVFQYVDAIVYDTPILDESFRNSLSDANDINSRIKRSQQMLNYLDTAIETIHDSVLVNDWKQVSLAVRNQIAEIEKAIINKTRIQTKDNFLGSRERP